MQVNYRNLIRECVREVLKENLSETTTSHPHQKTKKDIYALLAKAGFRPEGSQPREYMEYYLNGFATVFCMVRLDPNENEVMIQRYYDSERLDSMKGYHIEKSIPLPEAYTEEFVKEVVKECLRLQRSIRGDESIYGGMDDVGGGFDPQSQGPNPTDATGNPYAKWNSDMRKMEENEFDGKKWPKHNAKISPQEKQEANEVAKKIWGDELKNITFHSKSLNGRETFFEVDTNSTYCRWLNKNKQGKWYYTDDEGIRAKWVPFESVSEGECAVCGTCNGSGEGMADGTKCSSCGGSGDSERPWGKKGKRHDPDYEPEPKEDPAREWGGMDEGGEHYNKDVIYKDRQGGRDVYYMNNKDTGGKIEIKSEAVQRMLKRGGYRLVDINEVNLKEEDETSPYGMNRHDRRDLSNKLAATDTSAGDRNAKSAAMQYLKDKNPAAAYKISAERQRLATLKGMGLKEQLN